MRMPGSIPSYNSQKHFSGIKNTDKTSMYQYYYLYFERTNLPTPGVKQDNAPE